MILYHALEVDNVIQNTVGRSRFTLILYISLFELRIEATILWPILCRFFWSNCFLLRVMIVRQKWAISSLMEASPDSDEQE